MDEEVVVIRPEAESDKVDTAGAALDALDLAVEEQRLPWPVSASATTAAAVGGTQQAQSYMREDCAGAGKGACGGMQKARRVPS